MTFLQHFVYCDQSLERLNLVGQDGLAEHMASQYEQTPALVGKDTHTFIPAQKDWEDLWSHVYTMQLRTCFPRKAFN